MSERVRQQSYSTVGSADAPVVLVLGGISGTRHVTSGVHGSGWWRDVATEGGALDPEIFRILSVDWIGSPSAAGPGRPLTTHDQAEAIVGVLDTLGIEHLHAAVGASYGGMVALALAERWPARVERLVVLSAAHRSTVMATAHRVIQRRIVELGVSCGDANRAMTLARALAMSTYRTAAEFDEKFSLTPHFAEPGGPFDVERYLLHAGEKFARAMSPERFLALSLSADLHNVVPERVTVPTTVIAAEGDLLIPASSTQELYRRLANPVSYEVIVSRAGHDAFLTEPDQVNKLLATTLAEHANAS